MSTLLTPDIELFVDLATAYPDSLVISGTPFVLSGFRALQDDGLPGHLSVVHTGNSGDKIAVCAIKFLHNDPQDYPHPIVNFFKQCETDGAFPLETSKGTIMVVGDWQAQHDHSGSRYSDKVAQGAPPLRAVIKQRRAQSVDWGPGSGRNPAVRSRRSFSTSTVLSRPKHAETKMVVDVHTYKTLDHASRLGTQVQQKLANLENMAQQAQALADEDLTQLRTYANAVADERKILAQLSGMQEQVNGHVSEIDHQSYRTQYEVALLEDKSRESYELVDNFLNRVGQIR